MTKKQLITTSILLGLTVILSGIITSYIINRQYPEKLVANSETSINVPVIKAGRYVLVNGENEQCASLFIDKNGKAHLVIGDEDDGQRLDISRTGFALYDQKNNTRILMDLPDGKDSKPKLNIYDKSGIMRIALMIKNDDEHGLYLYDQSGNTRADFKIKNKEASLVLKDAQGQTRVNVNMNENDGPQISLLDENGKPEWTAKK